MNAPLIMGIINVTPDSFSGDGVLLGTDYVARAVAQAEAMIADGADILDVGGESSRPGSAPVSAEEEIRRVVPVIAAITKKLGSTCLVAVDTVKAGVAEKALQAGATIINDISALSGDARMAEVAARYGAKIVLMHNRAKNDAIRRDAKIGCQYEAPHYEDVVEEVVSALKASVAIAIKAGITQDKIILDPGLGFGKTPEQNLELIMKVEKIKKLGFLVLMAPSRKSFIGHVLDVTVDERLEGTAACIAISVLNGADIVRVHDVKFMARVAKMATALKEAN